MSESSQRLCSTQCLEKSAISDLLDVLGEAARPIRNVVHEGLLGGGGFNWYHPGAMMRGFLRSGG